MLKDSAAGYGLLSIILHWVSALLIVGLFGLGIYMVDLSYYDDMYHKAPSLHISLGLVLFLLTVLRIVWRGVNPKPEVLPGQKPLAVAGAQLIKYVFYILIAVLVVTGYLITTADGKAASLFGLISFPVTLQLGADGVDLAGSIHEIAAWAMVVLAGVHGLAALLHHFLVRDRTLVRMLKPVRK